MLLLLLVNFVSGFRLELMYIPLIESVRWSLTHLHGFQLPVLLPTTVSYRNRFSFYQMNKFSESKVKFRQASDCFKRVLEAAKLEYANKTKESISSQKLGSQDFWQIANSVLNNGLLYLLYSMAQRCCLLHLITQNCLLKTFLKTLISMIQVSLYLFSLLELIWKCIIFL